MDSPDQPPDRKLGEGLATTDGLALLRLVRIDALVECTNFVYEAAEYCFAAIAQPAHVVLRNAEVDLMLGTLLAHEAARHGVVVTVGRSESRAMPWCARHRPRSTADLGRYGLPPILPTIDS